MTDYRAGEESGAQDLREVAEGAGVVQPGVTLSLSPTARKVVVDRWGQPLLPGKQQQDKRQRPSISTARGN